MLRQRLSHRGQPAALLIGATLVALTLSPADAARRATSARETARIAAERFVREQPGAHLTIDAETGLVRSLANLAPKGRPARDSVAAASEFLAEHRAML